MPVEDPVLAELPWLRQLARRLAAQDVDGDADDLVQDAWLMAHRDQPRAHEGRGLRPWLAQAMRNRLRSRQRSAISRMRRESKATPPASAEASAESRLMEADVIRSLDDALETLTEEQRALLRDRFFADRSAVDIASELGVPPATVRTRIRRSLLQLREALDERHGNDRARWASAVLAVPLGETVRGGMSVASTKGIVIGGAIAAAAVVGWVLFSGEGEAGSVHAANGSAAVSSPGGDAAPGRDASDSSATDPGPAPSKSASKARRGLTPEGARAVAKALDAADAGRAGDPLPTPSAALSPAEVRNCSVNAVKHDCDFLEPDPLVIEDMAACGIVRYDFPAMFAQRDWTPVLAEDWLDLVGAQGKERDAIGEVADAVREELYAELEALAVELGEGAWETDKTLFDAVIELSLAVGDDNVAAASRLVAQERAGRADPPEDLAQRPAAERFVRTFTAVGDRFESGLAERLGEGRAHELHMARDGWPGLRAQTGARCPD